MKGKTRERKHGGEEGRMDNGAVIWVSKEKEQVISQLSKYTILFIIIPRTDSYQVFSDMSHGS